VYRDVASLTIGRYSSATIEQLKTMIGADRAPLTVPLTEPLQIAGQSAALHGEGMYPVLSAISRRRKLKMIVDHCRPQDAILEVGAGSGWLAARLRERGYQVTTLDLIAPADVVGDVRQWRQLGLPAGAFDAIVALELIEHTDCLEALQCLCKPGGLIMLSSPHPRWDWVMKVLEGLRLTQRRTSPHDHLIDFKTIKMLHIHYRRPGLIHQVAIFVNRPRA
jgi:hypothetical protein